MTPKGVMRKSDNEAGGRKQEVYNNYLISPDFHLRITGIP